MRINIDDVFDGVKFIYDINKESKIKKYEDEFFVLIFKKLDNKEIYIDSNIFMTTTMKGIAKFFNEFSNYPDIKITMPKEQYEEIYNLKNNNENLESQASARSAFRIIEKLFDSNNLNILNLEENTIKKAYADPIFIKKIINNLKNKKEVFFITEDKDLKIRLKSKMKAESLSDDDITITNFFDMYKNKIALVDEERKRIKEIKEANDVLDEILNPSFPRRTFDKFFTWLDK